jgi:hypothetical protein
MGTRRHVESAMCIFDLTIGKAINLPESIRAKVMMLYTRKDNRREFKVLDLSFPEDVDRQIISWLEKNTEPDDILWELESLFFQMQDLGGYRPITPDVKVSHGNRQLEPPRSHAPGVEIHHSPFLHNAGLMRVAVDYNSDASSVRVQIQIGDVMNNIACSAGHLHVLPQP